MGNTLRYLIKLTLSIACLALTVAVIAQGEGRMRRAEAATAQPAGKTTAQPSGKTAALLADYEREAASVKDLGNTVQTLQTETQEQVKKRQDEINKGVQSQQIGNNLLKEIAAAAVNPVTGAVKNQKLKDLLEENGVTINLNQIARARQNAMSSDAPSRGRATETLPFVILAASVIALLAWLFINIQSGRAAALLETRPPAAQPGDAGNTAALDEFLVWQTKALADQRASLETAHTKLEDYLRTNLPPLDDQVAKSKTVQASLEKLASGLLELSKTDADAKALVTKYAITAPKEKASPSPEPAP